MSKRKLTKAEWKAEGAARFGEDMMKWSFVCPVCGHVASARDYFDAGAPEGAVGFSCIGRWLPNAQEAFSAESDSGPCNYTGGGLFNFNPVEVEDTDADRTICAFEFATGGDE